VNSNGQRRLVLFDFDGTLTRRDSLLAFLSFFRGNLYFVGKLMISLPGLLRYKLGLVDNSKAKEKLLRNFLKGISKDEFQQHCRKFANEKIPLMLNKSIADKFQEHLLRGDRVIIISASVEDWILPWAEIWEVEVLATKLAVTEDVITGKFDGKNCYGEEKVNRLKLHLDLNAYEEIWAYGDSEGDEPMLSLAKHVVYRGRVRN
jgi:phosphatidylglycerophosphatase C